MLYSPRQRPGSSLQAWRSSRSRRACTALGRSSHASRSGSILTDEKVYAHRPADGAAAGMRLVPARQSLYSIGNGGFGGKGVGKARSQLGRRPADPVPDTDFIYSAPLRSSG